MALPPLIVDEDLARASTIPSAWYVDPSALQMERQRVFESTWQLAGSTDQLPGPGSYLTTVIGREPVLIVRGSDGVIRAMSNVCRHRAGCVARGSGRKRVVQCTYHGWVYDLEGRLHKAPEFEGVQEFDGAALPQFRLELWNQLIFVNITGDAPPIGEVFGAIDEVLGSRDLAPLRHTHRKDWEIRCNWKVYVDNFLEGYHIPIVHPQLFRELDYAAYRTETFRWFSIQHSPIRRPERLRVGDGDDQALYFWIYPNLMLNIYPDNFSTNLIVPTGPESTVTVFEWFFPEGHSAQQEVERVVSFSDEIQLEDVQVCEDVQRNLHSATYDRGRYSVRRENGVHHFHRLFSEQVSRGTEVDER